jgi:serine/threonine protein kinase
MPARSASARSVPVSARARTPSRHERQQDAQPPAEAQPQARHVALFNHGQLARATEGFSDTRKIGGGGFGDVYRTSRDMTSTLGLGSSHDYVAIKKLRDLSLQGEREFLNEIHVLGAHRHENLLVLLGFSADKGLCLVTPLMRGGSLSDRLVLDAPARSRLAKLPDAPAGGHPPLTWTQRLTVALGALSGLAYLHTPDAATHKTVVLHGDIKPANILLDLNLNPRLADGGLARTLRPNASHATSVVSIAGTDGFMDEFYRQTGRYDAKSDAYSMGVTLLIILTGWPVFDEELGDIAGRCEVNASQVMDIADQRAEWPPQVAREMHKVALALVKRNRNARISVSDAKEKVQRLADRHLPSAPADGGEGMHVERECLVCMSAPRHFRFGECGHSALCRGCMDTFMSRSRPQCPTCRIPVSRQHLIEGDNVAREHTFVRPLASPATQRVPARQPVPPVLPQVTVREAVPASHVPMTERPINQLTLTCSKWSNGSLVRILGTFWRCPNCRIMNSFADADYLWFNRG